ncbi:hypothetical protein Aab01nite_77450 [Paractinoplanes abujensis]|uniref:Uncharacterized protein n=1 Tax=Paractinoplanes abujensis TaxID=882441 RepID=A0A7W7CPM9_9ACTN|nr:hypothetical protein [Actinoplanes abujensis]MBB4692368.1 hypothetical protein [Actinoplanes abujensis]GID24155.1 hypothetical protein Aab01nite_77450 [Actinoplanes abujensis]
MQNGWIRRVVIGLACLPVAAVSILHTMGRTGDFGVLGKWYVMLPLTLLGVLGWLLLERTVTASAPSQDEDVPDRTNV